MPLAKETLYVRFLILDLHEVELSAIVEDLVRKEALKHVESDAVKLLALLGVEFLNQTQ